MNLSLFKKTASLLLIVNLLAASFGQDLLSIKAQDDCIFTDVCDKGDVSYEAIKYLKDKQLIKGNPDGSFRGDDAINRAEVMTIAFRGFGGEIKFNPTHTFSDLKADDWFSPYVSTAKQQGFVQGYPDGTFKAGKYVTYEEAAKIFLKFYKVSLPASIDQQNPQKTPLFGFPSVNSYIASYSNSEWFGPYINTVEQFKLLENPDVTLGSSLSRKNVALLLYNTIQTKEDINSPLQLLSSWESYQGNVKNESDLYFYFNKPIELATAKQYIEITQNGTKLTNYDLFNTLWSYDNNMVGLDNYKYFSNELRIDSTTFKNTGPVKIIFKKGLKSTYGLTLQEDKTYNFSLIQQSSKLVLSGQSYFMADSKITNTIDQTSLSKLSAIVCKVDTSKYLSGFQQASYNTMNPYIHEYLPISSDPEKDPLLKKTCENINVKSLETTTAQSTREIDLEQIYGKKMTPGIYYVSVSAPEFVRYRGNFNTHRFIYVSDTSLTMKTDPTGTTSIWAFDLKTAKPQANIAMSLYSIHRDWTSESQKPTLIQKSITDQTGKAQFSIKPEAYNENEYIAVADSSNHFGIVSSLWNNGIEPYQYGLDSYEGYWGHDPRNDYTVYMHTDRKIYRPGHTVEIKGIVRKKTSDGYTLPTLKDALVKITDSLGNEIFSKTVLLSNQGSFTTNISLDTDAPLGTYTISAKTASPVDDEAFGDPVILFQVEDYRKPEFKVDYTLQENYLNGETLHTDIAASYYFGTAVQGGEATVTLSRESLYMYAEGNEWYNFFDTYACYFYCKDTSLGAYDTELTLDNKGKATLDIPLSLDDATSAGLYTMTISVKDKSGRSVSKSQTFKVHKSTAYVGIRSTNYVSAPNTKAEFDLLTIDTRGKSLGNIPVEVSFYKEDWTSYQKTDVSGDMISNSENMDTKLSSTKVTTDTSGKAKVSFTPTEPGSYYARSIIVDSKGNISSARDYVYVYSTDNTYTPWASTDSYKIQTILDKPKYKVGDTAKLIIQSPFEKATALITIEREKVLDTMIVDLTNNNTPISLPIKSSYIPNAFISVAVFSATGTPDFRQGYTKLYIDTTDRELSINLSTDKKTYQPREKVTIKVATTDSTGKKVPAEVSLAVVDEAVIALAGGVDKDIMNAFYYFRGIMVTTAQSLTHLVQKATLETVGGSGKGGASGLPIKRGNMKDTAYWNGTVQTDNDGNAQISFTLPDNLTQWEILSIGATKDTKVGSTAISIESKIDFVAEPILPRFLRSGDQATLSYTLFNLTDTDTTVSAILTIPGTEVVNNTKTVPVKAQSSTQVTWNVTVPFNVETLTLDMNATNAQGLGDHIETALKVYPAQVVDTFGKSGEGKGTFSTSLSSETLSNDSLKSAFLTLNTSAGLTSTLKNQLQYLLIYPYGCSEQTTSVLFSNVILKEYLEKSHLNIEGITSEKIEQNVSLAFQKLYNYQSESGGWSLWGGNENIENYLTAYVLSGLSYAEQNGFSVDINVIKKGRDYLLNQLSSGKMPNLNEQAFTISVLKNLGVKGVLPYAENLYKNRANLSIEGQSNLMVVYYDLANETAVNSEKSIYSSRVTLLKDALLSQLTKENGYSYIKADKNSDYFGFMYGNINANATLLRSLAYVDSSNTTLPSMITYLISQARDDRWATTHETSATLRGISEYLRTHNENNEAFKAKILINGKEVATSDFAQGGNSDSSVLKLPLNTLSEGPLKITIEAPKDKTVYYQTFVTYQKSAKEQYVENQNFVISRTLEYYKKDGSPTNTPLPLHIGDKVRVTLSFTPRYKDNGNNKRITIEDHLPAGLEALNPGINTTGKTDASFSIGWADHMEMRDQLVMLYMQDARQTQFSYDAQVIAEGTFSYPAVHAFEMYNPAVYAKSGATALRTER